MLVPPRSGFSIYEMSSWARGTIVPLLVLMANKPMVKAPTGFTVRELYRDASRAGELYVSRPCSTFSLDNAFLIADRLLAVGSNLFTHSRRGQGPDRTIQYRPHRRAEAFSRPMINGPMALKPPRADHPVIVSGTQAVDDSLSGDPDGHLIAQLCVSPLWDTALAASAARLECRRTIRRQGRLAVEQQIVKPETVDQELTLQPGGGPSVPNDWYLTSRRLSFDGVAASATRTPDALRMRSSGLTGFDAEPRRRLGVVRHRQHARCSEPHPVRRHGSDDRSADGDTTGRAGLMGSYHFDATIHGGAQQEFLRRTQEPSGAGGDGSELRLRHLVVLAGCASKRIRPRAARRGWGEVQQTRRRRFGEPDPRRPRRAGPSTAADGGSALLAGKRK